MPQHKERAMTHASAPQKAPKEPTGFLDSFFARLEFLMSRKTLQDRARRDKDRAMTHATAPQNTTKEPEVFLDSFFARLEFLLSKKTLQDRARR